MSSVDPRWPPPQDHSTPPRHRPHPVAYVFAVLLPLILLALTVAPAGVVWWRRPPTAGSGTTPPLPDPDATEGAPGVGDPYYPQAGNGGYDATRYLISVNWDVATETLSGTTTINAEATHRLNSFYFDLMLTPEQVSVNGKPATFERRGAVDVYVEPAKPIAAGSSFEVVVVYSGRPGEIRDGDVQPWWKATGEWTVAGEPQSSAWWYPANDHPSDPALMDVSIRVPAGMEAISVGRLESRDTGSEQDFDTWHWVARQPMATFLNFISIGQYEIKQGVERGLPFLYAVSEQLSVEDRQAAFTAMQTSVARVRVMETMFGPYPFSEVGGVVPIHNFWFGGLETQTRPIYQPQAILNRGFAGELVTHELAHMWFGDNVTLRQWNDIFNSEAYASWAQWGYNEKTGGRSANEMLNQNYGERAGDAEFWRVTMIDPTRPNLFGPVYVRGPMALQALRNVIGDEAFFGLTRDWAQRPGSRTLEEWMAAAQTRTTVDLDPFFQAWIYSPAAPSRTAANGFR